MASKPDENHPKNLTHFTGTLEKLREATKESKKLIVFDFSAKWCSPCKRVNQLMPNIAKDNEDVDFYVIDIESNQEISDFYQIRSVPVIKFLRIKNETLTEVDSMITFDEAKFKTKLENLKIT